jgi:tRNA nucleotidyltransferase/poly(A) polymerase
VFEELRGMLSIARAGAALRMLAELGLAQAILPALFDDDGFWAAALARVEAVAAGKDFELALAALLGELSPREIRRIVRRWGAANEVRDGLCWIARHLHDWRNAAEMPLADFKRLLAAPHFDRLRRLWAVQEHRETGRTAHARKIRRRAAGIAPDRISPAPLVTGDDLKKLGLPEGPRLGGVLRALYDAQLNETIRDRRSALEAAREMIGGRPKGTQ